MDQKQLFESLDKIPQLEGELRKLAQSAEANSKVTSDSIRTISSDIGDIKSTVDKLSEKVKSLDGAVSEASSKMKRDVSVKVLPTDVRIPKESIELPDWIRQMGQEYMEIKRRRDNSGKTLGSYLNERIYKALLIIVSVCFLAFIVMYFVKEAQASKTPEAYAERAYNAAVACDYIQPGTFYDYVRFSWDKEKEEVIKSVERLEERANWYKNIKASLRNYYEDKEIAIDKTQAKGNDVLVFWHFIDEEPNYIAHFWPDNRIDVADASKVKVKNLDDAHRLSKNKAWTTIQEAQPQEQVE